MTGRQRGLLEVAQQRLSELVTKMGSKQSRTDVLVPDSIRFRGGLPRAVRHPKTGRFINPWMDPTTGEDVSEKGFRDLVRMIREAQSVGMPTTGPPLSTPAVRWDEIRASAQDGTTSMTWLGHACVLIVVRGSIFLVDPVFAERCSPMSFAGPKRFVKSPVSLNDLDAWPDDLAPRCVLISHGHYDHLCLTTLAALKERFGSLDIIAPLGHRGTMESKNIKFGNVWANGLHSNDGKPIDGLSSLTELDWWGARTISGTKGLSVVAIPAQHWTSRAAFDRNRALWCGFSILAADDEEGIVAKDVIHEPCESMRVDSESNIHPLGTHKVVHAGDTGYCNAFQKMQQHMGGSPPEIAAIPIGAYDPRWFMRQQHTNPAEGVQMHKDIGASISLSIHWGTFPLTSEPTKTQLRDLNEARRAADVGTEQFLAVLPGTTVRAKSSPDERLELDVGSQFETIITDA